MPSDTQAPEAHSFEFAPRAVNVGSAPGQVKFTVRASDDLAGIRDVSVYLRSPSGRQHVGGATLSLADGDALNGTYIGTATIPQYAESGTWVVEGLRLTDNAGNSVHHEVPALESRGFPVNFDVSAD
jgi:hypothetical protein